MNNDIKPRLKAILSNHQGRARAITRRELRNTLGYQNDRKLRLIIRELRHEGFPILSSSAARAGYYMPSSQEELNNCLAEFRSRLIEDAKARRDLKIYGARFLTQSCQGILL